MSDIIYVTEDDLKFESISDFKWCMKRGGEVQFIWKGITYCCFGCLIPKDDSQAKMFIAQSGPAEKTSWTEKWCDTADELLEYMVGSDCLRDVITQVAVIERTIEVSTLMIWIFTGVWWPFAVGMAAVIALGVLISARYFTNTVYICPECHSRFRPRLREALFARHTPNTRRLNCIHCGHHGFCIETFGKENEVC